MTKKLKIKKNQKLCPMSKANKRKVYKSLKKTNVTLTNIVEWFLGEY